MKRLALRTNSSATRPARVGVNDWLHYDKSGENHEQNTNKLFHIDTPLGAATKELLCGDSSRVKAWYESLLEPCCTEQALGGWAYLNLNNLQGAVETLEQAIANGCLCHGLLAAACHQIGMDTLASSVLNKGRTVVEDAPLEFQIFWYRENAEQVYRESPRDSIAFFNHALHLAFQDARTHPLIPGISVLKAAALARLGYDYDAFHVAKTALDFSPSSARQIQLLYRMLISQLNLGSLPRASRIAEQIECHNDNSPLAAYALGRYFLAIECDKEAKGYLLTATTSQDIEVAIYAHLYLALLEKHTGIYHLERAKQILLLNPNDRVQAHYALHEAQVMVAQSRSDAPKYARVAITLMQTACPPTDLARAYAVLADALCIGQTEVPTAAIEALVQFENLRGSYYLGRTALDSDHFTNLAYEAMYENTELHKVAQRFLRWSAHQHGQILELAIKQWETKHRNLLALMEQDLRHENYVDLLFHYDLKEKHPEYQRCEIAELMDAHAAIAHCRLGHVATAIAIMKKSNKTGLKNRAMLEIIEAKCKLSTDEINLLYISHNLRIDEQIAELTLYVSPVVLTMILQFSKTAKTNYVYVGANYQIGRKSELFLLNTLTGEEHCVLFNNMDFNSFSDLTRFFA